MPIIKMTVEERKESARLSQERWRDNNRDKIADYNFNFREKNPDYHKNYFKSAAGRRANLKNSWRIRGIVHPNMDILYDQYEKTTNCENCAVKLTNGRGSTSKCCDHEHKPPVYPMLTNYRNILCKTCNCRRR